MSLRSIYHKTCPSCAAPVELDVDRCDCGYAFGALSTGDAEPVSDDQATQEQELMREYLNARITQAIDELKSVQAVLDADPKNLDKAGRLMKAHAALRELRNELGAQQSTVARPTRDAEPETFASEPTATSTPGETFRAAQANKAEQIMQAAGMTTKDCPRCRAVLPERSALCFCGFAFARENARAVDTDAQSGEGYWATP